MNNKEIIEGLKPLMSRLAAMNHTAGAQTISEAIVALSQQAEILTPKLGIESVYNFDPVKQIAHEPCEFPIKPRVRYRFNHGTILEINPSQGGNGIEIHNTGATALSGLLIKPNGNNTVELIPYSWNHLMKV